MAASAKPVHFSFTDDIELLGFRNIKFKIPVKSLKRYFEKSNVRDFRSKNIILNTLMFSWATISSNLAKVYFLTKHTFCEKLFKTVNT